MPTPHPDTETKDEFVSRCIPQVLDEGTAEDSDQAVAICMQMWKDAAEKSGTMKQQRAYSVLEIRSTDEDKRIIEGIASTPAIDSYNTILEPKGAEFRLPLPVLYQHNSRQPIGHVISAKATDNGIRVQIQIAKSGIAHFIDEAWALIKNGLVRGLSVGFDPIEETFDKSFNGIRYLKWRWLELSTVTIAANQDATMSAVRSADEAILAALGTSNRSFVVLNPPGASGHSKGKAMTIKEHIAALEAKRAANDKDMDDIMELCAKEGRSRDDAEQEKYDGFARENTRLDADIAAYKEREKTLAARAAVIDSGTAGQDPEKIGKNQRTGTGRIEVRANQPKGIGMARIAIAMWHARNNPYVAADLCQKHWPDSPELGLTVRSIVDAADTTTSGWASQLVPAAQQLQGEFLDMYRAATIINRIPGLRRVPFNVAVPLRTAAGTFQWVGEALPKPVTSETFDRITLTWAKAAAITVITKELAKFSSPSAELLIRDSMVETLRRHFDAHFVSTTAAVSGVSPAGILNGISAIPASGTTPAFFRTDMNNMLNNFTANNVPSGDVVILMSDTIATALSLMVTDLGVRLFPEIDNGMILKRPLVISEAVGTNIIGVKASDILLAEDPAISVSVSDQATIEMETTPTVGEQSPPSTQSALKSMFQSNSLAILCEQFITWARARTVSVNYISGAAYVP